MLFPIFYCLIILSFNTISFELLKTSIVIDEYKPLTQVHVAILRQHVSKLKDHHQVQYFDKTLKIVIQLLC